VKQEKERVQSRRCKRNSGQRKNELIRIKDSVRRDLQFIKGIIGLNTAVPDGDVVESLISMFKQKKIGQLNSGKGFSMPIEADSVIDFLTNKETEQALKDYEYVLQEKQSSLDNYVEYLDTACELVKLEKKQVIQIVENKQKQQRLKQDVVV
jgi:hypothetical protein